MKKSKLNIIEIFKEKLIIRLKKNLEKKSYYLFFLLISSFTNFSCTNFPLPDPSKKDTLLLIPVSITIIHNSKDKFGITFEREYDKKQKKLTFSQSKYQSKEFILVEDMEPGTYYVQSLSFFTRSGKESVITNYHDGSNGSERKKNKGKAEFRKKPRVRFELKDNHVNIPKFKIEFWEEKKEGRCCQIYLYLINNFDDLSRNQLIDELNKLENFKKWELTL